jgi:hypothetical protein
MYGIMKKKAIAADEMATMATIAHRVEWKAHNHSAKRSG